MERNKIDQWQEIGKYKIKSRMSIRASNAITGYLSKRIEIGISKS